ARAPGPGHDVPHHHGPGRRAVAPPKLTAVRAVTGPEKQRASDFDRVGEATVASRVDVLDQHRARRGPVASPRLVAECRRLTPREQRPVEVRHAFAEEAAGTRDDVLDLV